MSAVYSRREYNITMNPNDSYTKWNYKLQSQLIKWIGDMNSTYIHKQYSIIKFKLYSSKNIYQAFTNINPCDGCEVRSQKNHVHS